VMPKAIHKIRIPEMIERVLEDSAFPQELIVPKAEFDEKVAAMEQMEAQIANARLMAEMSKAVPNVGKKVDPSSVLAKASEGGA
ncbi:MAG: hypothetical protein KKF27_21015, partial [Gammaproteobacteria bacterium]|nr:hypothetical protein [Gammaproteobacteria bacterium]MBU2685732.1 hypothetical protein [Gammaproteobacteria bacterium]